MEGAERGSPLDRCTSAAEGGGQPLYESTARSDPVWQVCWQRTNSHELQLCSISTDGRVSLWSISKNELSCQDLLQLRSLKAREDLLQPPPQQQAQQPPSSSGTAGAATNTARGTNPASSGSSARSGSGADGGIAGGCCFDFNREQDYLFIVGCEDGSLYKCSTAYASEYLQVGWGESWGRGEGQGAVGGTGGATLWARWCVWEVWRGREGLKGGAGQGL